MPESRNHLKQQGPNVPLRLAIVLLAVSAAVYLLAANIDRFGAILMVLFGFGGVIMVHEFGHFLVGKLCEIRVEAFSIGFSPVLLGLRRTARGMHIRILPTLVPRPGGEPGQGALDFTFGRPGREWETEYRIGLIPFGGFVALLGQEDVGVAERTSDPRSFLNKTLLQRIAVIVAGVTFNAISALIIFMIIFHNGIHLQAPVIGDVIPGSPACMAGLKPGDEIVSVERDTFIDFTNIALAGALSDANQPVSMVVKRTAPDGVSQTFPVSLVARVPGGDVGLTRSIRIFGVDKAYGMEIRKLANRKERARLLHETGLMERDIVAAVNGRPVRDGVEFENAVSRLLAPEMTLTVERKDPKTGAMVRLELPQPLTLTMATYDFDGNYSLNSAFGMVPRLKVAELLSPEPNSPFEKAVDRLKSLVKGRTERLLRKGDVIVRVGHCEYPTYPQLRAVLTDYTGDAFARAARGEKPARLTVVVERVVDGRPQEVTLAVMPQLARRPDEPSLLGIVPAVDLESPQVAGIIDTADGLQPGSIPPGARIINIGGSDVSSFFDIIAALRKSAGRQVDIRWQKGGDSGVVAFQVPSGDEGITFRSALVRTIPFDDLRRLYKADSPLQAIVMGWKRTELFIKQAVVTLGQLISGALSPRTLSGPLGIVTATYRIASEGHISFYFYWLGLLSATIAVMNLLPLPILDGGLIVLMLIEKIKGSPISQRTQAALNYAGLAIIVGLMVYVTFNDIDMFFR